MSYKLHAGVLGRHEGVKLFMHPYSYEAIIRGREKLSGITKEEQVF